MPVGRRPATSRFRAKIKKQIYIKIAISKKFKFFSGTVFGSKLYHVFSSFLKKSNCTFFKIYFLGINTFFWQNTVASQIFLAPANMHVAIENLAHDTNWHAPQGQMFSWSGNRPVAF